MRRDSAKRPRAATEGTLICTECGRIAGEGYADHSSARVGALRTLMDLIGRRLNLLIVVGKLPRNYVDFAEVPGAREMD